MRDVCARFKYSECDRNQPCTIEPIVDNHVSIAPHHVPLTSMSSSSSNITTSTSVSNLASPSREWIHHCLQQYYQDLDPVQPFTEEAIERLTQRIQYDLAPYSILKLGGFSLGTIAPKVLGSILTDPHTQLRTLDLGFNRITDRGATLLARALSQNTSLESLYLSGNEIGPQGVSELASALMQNCTLQSLHLSGNNIGEEGAHALAKGLESNTGLRSLYIGTNGIGSKGIASLAQALMVNQRLEELALGQNKMTSEGLMHIASSFRSGRVQLTTLEIGTNGIDATGVVALVQALQPCSNRLEKLYLDNNPIGDIGANALGLWLATTSMIRVLDVSYAQLSLKGLRSIEHGVTKSRSLICLLMDGHDWSSTRYIQPTKELKGLTLSSKAANTFAATCLVEGILANSRSVLSKLTGVDLSLVLHLLPNLSIAERERLMGIEHGLARRNERILEYLHSQVSGKTRLKRKHDEEEEKPKKKCVELKVDTSVNTEQRPRLRTSPSSLNIKADVEFTPTKDTSKTAPISRYPS